MPRVAKAVSVAPNKTVDATDHQIGQDSVVTMAATGEPELVRDAIQVVDGPNWKNKADNLAFAEEPVTVTVHPTSDKYASQIVSTAVQGRTQNFIRGQSVTVKRKFVEVLARAKPVNFRNEEYVNSEGDKAFRWPSTTGLLYPFQIDHDANPNGRAWLRKILAEG